MSSNSGEDRSKAVTLQDIADYCGVTRSVVSFALSGNLRHASAATAERIREAAKTLGYNPARYHAARRLVNMRDGKHTLNYLVVMYVAYDYHLAAYSHRMASGVLNEMASNGYGVLIVQTPAEQNDDWFLPRAMVQGEVDGVIGDFNDYVVENTISQIRKEPGFGNRPVVSMIFDHPSLSSVTVDDCNGGYQAMSHLLDLGHRHILSNERDYGFPHSTRVEGYRKALVDRGLDPYDESVLHLPWFQSPEKDTAEDIVAELERHPEITGFLAYNDVAAVDLVLALRARGIRIPEDVSIVGYDGTHSVPDYLGTNILTTVRLPLLEMGQTAAQVLIRMMNSPTPEDEHIVLPVELVVRGSTGPPKVG